MAYSSKNFDLLNNRYWVILGDGECAEGNKTKTTNKEILISFQRLLFNLKEEKRLLLFFYF